MEVKTKIHIFSQHYQIGSDIQSVQVTLKLTKSHAQTR